MEQRELTEKVNQSEHENRQMLGREEQKEVSCLRFCSSVSSSFSPPPLSSWSVSLCSSELPDLEVILSLPSHSCWHHRRLPPCLVKTNHFDKTASDISV